MSDTSTIEWTDATWNPVTGCTKVSEGCDHCYAETFAERWRGIPGHPYEQGFDLKLWPERLDMPLRWRKPRRVFVNSMSDLFHDGVPDEFIAQVFAIMAEAPQHTFQVLTKRPGRMASLLRRPDWWDLLDRAVCALPDQTDAPLRESSPWPRDLPLPNVWLGTSVENQKWADVRIPKLLQTPAAVRFLSCEPLLDRVDLSRYLALLPITAEGLLERRETFYIRNSIDWVIVGGESGPQARPMHPTWARQLRDQTTAAGVAFFFKQWGVYTHSHRPEHGDYREPDLYVSADTGRALPDGQVPNVGDWQGMWRVGKKAAGRELDGRTWDQYPEVRP